ncbi:hypothetical protein V9T40_000910 [Parthenolecanium corni]|uniref:Uncharacterized protein n=1 Tax=Parthenolecanium corni TaxID=536013 RepID=A0AAN9TBV6_9HEMI
MIRSSPSVENMNLSYSQIAQLSTESAQQSVKLTRYFAQLVPYYVRNNLTGWYNFATAQPAPTSPPSHNEQVLSDAIRCATTLHLGVH